MEQQKPRSVDLARLQQMSDGQLQERITKSPQKVQKKKDQIEGKIKDLQQQLTAYVKYRTEDVAACKKTLEERKGKKESLPSGGASTVKKAA